MPDVLHEVRERGIGWITLNRPEALNALSTEMQAELAQVIADAARDPAVRVLVLTGAGRGFCSGGDVRSQVQRRQLSPEAAERAAAFAAAGAPLPANLEANVLDLQARQVAVSLALHTLPKPVIAAVNGAAAGAGMSIALACDIRIASDRARFTTAFRNVGLSGDYGGSYFLTRLAGDGVARELYFTGRAIDADEALRSGIVNRVVEHNALEAETMALARTIADGPVGVYARMKRNLNLAAHADLRTVLESEALNMTLSGITPDAREAGRAFVEKRKPQFS
ncbi:MAG TPA: enoyl-CoA hydratase-related protein [Dehalococcoidia bacterium]|nr:enoyl-CoA hydratase-related protein [Dehalococcoidia bacterium]